MLNHDRRLRPGEVQLVRRVDRLHPRVEVNLTAADLEYYRSLGRNWAAVLDRQSKKRILTQEEKTGQENRVRQVLEMARSLGLVLPTPTENLNRQEGEFQFRFDDTPACFHWFVDGLEANASGYTASPFARRQLWRAAKIARMLRDHGCAPSAVLIGELTRFFRDPRQFIEWYHILKGSGARIQIYGCPELNPENEGMLLPMLLCQTDALSTWLQKNTKAARQSRKNRGELFSLTAPFGLRFDLKTRKDVYAEEAEWGLIQDAIARVLRGELRNCGEVIAWLVEAQEAAGIPTERRVRSRRWVHNLISSDMLEGIYRQYKEENLPCRIEDDEGRQDWDIRPNGSRRYVVVHKPDEGLVFPIQLQPHQRIPEADLTRVRAILSRKGRTPAREPIASPDYNPHRETLFRVGIIRCRHCGQPVEEKNPVMDPSRKRTPWTRAQDELLVEMLGQGKKFDQIATELTRLSEQHTGRHREITRQDVNRRKSRQQYHGSLEENKARLVTYWDDPFSRRQDCWHLYCCGVGRLARQKSKRVEQVREWPEMQHHRKRIGSLSLALEPMLWEAAGKDPRIHLGDIPPPPSRQKLNRLDGELSRLRRLLSKIQEGFEAGVYTAEEAKRRLEPLRTDEERLTAERDAEQADLLAENDVAELRARQQLQADVHAIVSHPEFRNSITWRRKFVELVVREVIVDLETGEFEAHTRFQDEPLRRLAGELVRDPNPLSGQNATYPTPASHR